MSRTLIRQGEGPLASAIRLHLEQVEQEQKLARIILEAGGQRDPEPDEPELPTHRVAPLLLMDPAVRRGFPFTGGAAARKRIRHGHRKIAERTVRPITYDALRRAASELI